MPEMNRRSFLVTTAATACAACCAGAMFSEIADAAEASAAGAAVNAGPLTGFPKDGVYDAMARTQKILIIRNGDELYASSAVCTHKGAIVQAVDGKPFCKAHKSQYSIEGTVTSGPAKSSLPRFAVSLNDKHVMVDKSKSFAEKDWADPASFVKLT